MLPTPGAAGSELRTWRALQGLTLKQLAEALGVHWITVQRWETGVLSVPPYLHLALRELERQLTDDAAPEGMHVCSPDTPVCYHAIRNVVPARTDR